LEEKPKDLEDESVLYKLSVSIDRRKTLRDLKDKVALSVGLGLDQLIFRRGGSHGLELVEDELTVKAIHFYNNMSIFLEKGTPSIVGQKRLKFFTT